MYRVAMVHARFCGSRHRADLRLPVGHEEAGAALPLRPLRLQGLGAVSPLLSLVSDTLPGPYG